MLTKKLLLQKHLMTFVCQKKGSFINYYLGVFEDFKENLKIIKWNNLRLIVFLEN